ncbi:hypothetical protein XFF6990_140238 [Xanthomonas citri pv. fuscans]|uniref:Uncharacterized protein n=1 Tax=Xanthomonas campestris pv. phaseoli TaxID=317013 RepID=A0A7Z7NFJ8_XANCH|nr:hypothetical protein XFF6990_140238 [Xanthomonas citri pv. fuscans]SOO22168.1 hypothetical protein XFF6991_120035 [Xanthomonas phaseoli pv. phaseoli]
MSAEDQLHTRHRSLKDSEPCTRKGLNK